MRDTIIPLAQMNDATMVIRSSLVMEAESFAQNVLVILSRDKV